MGDDLVAFLNARLDEDEALIREVCSAGGQAARDGREVAAKRAILAAHWAASSQPEEAGLEIAVRHLAIIYSGHPDYRQDWA